MKSRSFWQMKMVKKEIWLDLTVFNQNYEGYISFIRTVQPSDDDEGETTGDDYEEEDQAPEFWVQFESSIRYVDFPDLSEIGVERKHAKPENSPRSDVMDVLDWLSDKGVKEIIELRVPDSWDEPHSEEIIEKAIKDFNIEVLDWRRIDLSIRSVKKGAGSSVTDLHLYSSGNWTALEHWTGQNGVVQLESLKKLYVTIVKDNISEDRVLEQEEELTSRLNNISQNQAKWTFEVSPNNWRAARPVRESVMHGGVTESTPELIFRLNDFLRTYKSFQAQQDRNQFRRIKVAIIDNGVDESAFKSEQIAKGRSFVRREHTMGLIDKKKIMRESPWWLSIDAHGTQMAQFICAVDPCCELYIAKVCERRNDITLERVYDAVKWAAAQKVDIISMSLCMYETSEKFQDLVTNVVRSQGIVILCSTADEGNNNQEVWPAKHIDTLAIAACNLNGKLTQWSTDTGAQYHFPGEDITTELVPYDLSRKKISGSSVATALAAGVASLVLACYRYVPLKEGEVEAALRNSRVEKSFKRMRDLAEEANGYNSSVSLNPKYVRPWLVFRERVSGREWFQKHMPGSDA
ncbi:subtilisin-like protein [Hyaloscypha variabilis F]|uniref:Subtilisin-like protein n=1 Tax=Hyaloscypha variabilis (strain UAMH 11265 / GT02V1 / F) TaxID=1149755 RepID=A0A2J6RHQ9_HYAVF|nr:subtilisin-like protein [Hyaloscypha variabilis F]